MARVNNIDPSIYFNIFKGINNLDSEKNIDNNSLVDAINMDIQRDGHVVSREGWEIVTEYSNGHSLWSDNKNLYLCENNNLIKIDKNNVESIIDSGNYLNNNTSFIDDINAVVFSNKDIIKRYYKNKIYEIAPEKFNNNFSVEYSQNSSLFKGRYLVACTFIFDNGIEGGTSNPIEVEIKNDNTGFNISNLVESYDSNIVKIRVYLSNTNSSTLYHYDDYPVDIGNININRVNPNGKVLENISLDKIKSGDLLEKYKNCIFTAKDNYVYVSNPMSYLQDGFYYEFEGYITLLLATTDGLYISDENNLYWCAGEPKSLSRDIIYHSPAIKYSQSKNILTNELFFFTQQGQIVAKSGGQIENITESMFLPDKKLLTGASLVRNKNGQRHVINSFTSGDEVMGVGSWAKETVIRAPRN